MKIKNSVECWIVSNNQVLLLEVDKGKGHPKFLQPVTGGIEPGENSLIAVCREIYEETGLHVRPNELEQIINGYQVYIQEELLKIIKDVFILRLEKPFEVCISSEHTGYSWVHSTKVNKLLYWDSNKETYTIIESRLQGN
ncbi:NUDIX domain-containing protein [Paenibacillus sp. YPG26]|uniref:NUDIX domain-containing protein n=1 Tax=Paenibacillus sp. YPG26 TaxID=2878915 RepID=UPI00203B869D|nr:NUDIX domain-containing protein [Paenibacillus sp. YPG26]USB33398.1 NUDIX domain-containing protein [Paenibacillus sp. YPG26]